MNLEDYNITDENWEDCDCTITGGNLKKQGVVCETNADNTPILNDLSPDRFMIFKNMDGSVKEITISYYVDWYPNTGGMQTKVVQVRDWVNKDVFESHKRSHEWFAQNLGNIREYGSIQVLFATKGTTCTFTKRNEERLYRGENNFENIMPLREWLDRLEKREV